MYGGIEIGIWQESGREPKDVSIIPRNENRRPSLQERQKNGITVHHVYGGGIWFVLYIEHIHTKEGIEQKILGADLLSKIL